jgi:hypothetical protein
MWIGTYSGGVYKWTAKKAGGRLENGFTPFTIAPRTLIEKLYIDNKGFLWVCTTADGAYKINPKDGSIVEHYSNKGKEGKRLLDKGVGNVFEYDDTTMIFAAAGLNILNTKTNTFTYVTTSDGLPSGIINAIEADDNGELWMSFIIGIGRLNLQKKTFSFYDRSDGIVNDAFTQAASLRLSNGDFLFGTSSDFTVFNPANFVMETVPPDVQITGFSVSNQSLQTDSLLSLDNIDLGYSNNSIVIDLVHSATCKKTSSLIFI